MRSNARAHLRGGCVPRPVTVDEGITPPVSASEPCAPVSWHTAPQGYAPGHGYPGGLVICTLAPPPSGSSLPRSMAGSRPLQHDSSRSPPYHRPQAAKAASVPRGLGCLGNPPPLRLRLTPTPRGAVQPGCRCPASRVAAEPSCIGLQARESALRGSAVPHPRVWRCGGPHASPGVLGGVPGSAADPPIPSLCRFGRSRSSA